MFDPSKHTIKVRGNAEYLPVSARLVWFRSERPEWSIITDPLTIDHVKEFAVFRCSIIDETGRIISTATKMEDRKGFGDWLEKAETGSVGRALAMCGFGAAQAPEFDEGQRLADSPIGEVNECPPPPPPPPEPDARYSLLNALCEQAKLNGIGDLVTAGDYKGLSKFAGTICRFVGRESLKSLTTDDIATAIANVSIWAEYQRKPITEAPSHPEDNLPELNDTVPVGGVLFEVPVPSVVVQGGYADMEAVANSSGKAEPQGGKRKVSGDAALL